MKIDLSDYDAAFVVRTNGQDLAEGEFILGRVLSKMAMDDTPAYVKALLGAFYKLQEGDHEFLEMLLSMVDDKAQTVKEAAARKIN